MNRLPGLFSGACFCFFCPLNMLKKRNPSNRTGTVAIIPAAGSGVRMGSDRAKQFLEIDGRPLLAATLKTFENCQAIDAVIVVVPAKDVGYCRKEIISKYKMDKVRKVVPGGKRRQDSVRLGLEAAEKGYELALIHDGVRPVISAKAIEWIIDAAKTHGAVISGIPAKETVKEVDGKQVVVRTCDRKRMWLIQTPQVFPYDDLLAVHRKAFDEAWAEATDDSVLIEKLGIPVKVLEGSERNIKVTSPNDLELAKFYLRDAENIRNPT